MTAIRFNAITYSNKLHDAGLNKKIADVQAQEMSDIINNDLSTKQDLLNLEINIKQDLVNLENRLESKLANLENRLESKLIKFITENNWKLVGFMMTFQAIILSIFHFIK